MAATTIIEVVLPVANRAMVQEIINTTLSPPLGEQVYDDYDEMLFVIQVEENSLPRHTQTLGQLLQRRLITSFHCVSCELVSVVFTDAVEQQQRWEILHTYPFREGESWFPAVDNAKAYLCLRSAGMTSQQLEWLDMHPNLYLSTRFSRPGA